MQELQRNPEMMRQMMAMQGGGAGGSMGMLAQNPELLAQMMQVCTSMLLTTMLTQHSLDD